MHSLSGKEVFELLQSNKSLQKLYDKVLPMLERYVTKNSGTTQDAKDLFQESIVIVFRKCQETNFQLTSSIETFIFSISKRMWLTELRKKKKNIPLLEISNEFMGNDLDQLIIEGGQSVLFVKHFEQLSDSCKEVLRNFFNGLEMNEMAKKMGFASGGYARKRKHQCQEKLVKSIKADSIFKELYNGRF